MVSKQVKLIVGVILILLAFVLYVPPWWPLPGLRNCVMIPTGVIDWLCAVTTFIPYLILIVIGAFLIYSSRK